MADHDWNAHYAAGELPWDTGEPDPFLVESVTSGVVSTGRALEVGCGTGTNALWLARRGFDVLALDLAPLAIERARAKAVELDASLACQFEVGDFLNDAPSVQGCSLVYDRGCFHTFSEPDEQAAFAARVAQVLEVGGLWLSILGSTEGAPRDTGPPRRTARELTAAIEPVLEIVTLRAVELERIARDVEAPRAWYCLSRRRAQPAQPSSRF